MKMLLLHNIGSQPGRYTLTPSLLDGILRINSSMLLTFDDGYRGIVGPLADMPEDIRRRVIVFAVAGKLGEVNDWDASGELSGAPLMTAGEIRELNRLGVKIGSHGHTHCDLRKLEDDKLMFELLESKNRLQAITGASVDSFAYPFGYFDARVIAACRKAGYRMAVTTSDSLWEGYGDPYRKRRIEIKGSDSRLTIRMKTSGIYDIKAFWELPVLCMEKMRLYKVKKTSG